MPLFLITHTAPGLAPDEVTQNSAEVLKSTYAQFKHVYVNLREGFIVSIYEAPAKADVERELERVGFPWDSVRQLDFAASEADLRRMTGGAERTRALA